MSDYKMKNSQMKATPEDWAHVEVMSRESVCSYSRCPLEIRSRIEALEAQAAQPAQVEQGRGPEPLWHSMYEACRVAAYTGRGDLSWRTAAEIVAVADWLESHRTLEVHDAVKLLRVEAQATREGRRD